MTIFKCLGFALALTITACRGQLNSNETILPIVDDQLGVDSTFSIGFLNEIAPQLNNLFEHTQRYVVVYFDANCSACVSIFLDFLIKTDVNTDASYLYIGATSQDLLIVEHYIENMGRQLNWNEHLLPDTEGYYLKYNPLVATEMMPLIITDKDLNVEVAVSLYDIDKLSIVDVLP